jgi:hypothetical protein
MPHTHQTHTKPPTYPEVLDTGARQRRDHHDVLGRHRAVLQQRVNQGQQG